MTDVQAINPKRTYSASTTPTTAQVEAHIISIAAQLDTLLQGRGLTTPVSEPPEFVAHLKQVNAYGAAALAETGQFPEAQGLASTPHGAWLWSIYNQMIKALKDDPLPVTAQSVDPFSFFTEHEGDEPEEEQAWREPKFRKNKDF